MPPLAKAAWEAFAAESAPEPPQRISASAFAAMREDERDKYLAACLSHNAKLGPYAVGSHKAILDALSALIHANDRLPADRIRPGGAIDGLPNLGKTTLLRVVGRRYHRAMRDHWGRETAAGDEYWPVCHICLPDGSSIRGLNQKFIEFFGLVERDREPLASSTKRVIAALRLAGTSLVLIDDLHYVKPHQLKGQALNDHLKHLMNEVPATFVFAGVGLLEAGIFKEGKGPGSQQYAQLARRLRRFSVQSLAADSSDWAGLLSAIQSDLRLLRSVRLADRVMSDYLFGRTGGSLGDLADLIRLAADLGLERDSVDPENARGITIDVLEAVTLSHGAEASRSSVRMPDRRTRRRELVAA